MRGYYLIGLLVLSAGIGIIFSTLGGASRYVLFREAFSDTTRVVHVVGRLPRDSEGKVVGLRESADHLRFHFLLEDTQGVQSEVFYGYPMPMDFTRADEVVIVGRGTKGGGFLAQKILLKCPSKYESEFSSSFLSKESVSQ